MDDLVVIIVGRIFELEGEESDEVLMGEDLLARFLSVKVENNFEKDWLVTDNSGLEIFLLGKRFSKKYNMPRKKYFIRF